MPYGDGTGPLGTGPIGRGRGGCKTTQNNENNTKNQNNENTGFFSTILGIGRGLSGLGRGFRNLYRRNRRNKR